MAALSDYMLQPGLDPAQVMGIVPEGALKVACTLAALRSVV